MASVGKGIFIHEAGEGRVIGTLLQLTIVVLSIRAALGGGLRGSLRGGRVDIVHDIVDELSEGDMPNLDWPEETDGHLMGADDLAEVADSDENDDVVDSEGQESAQGADEEEVVDNDEVDGDATVEHLTRIGNLVDSNEDGILSPEELKAFADSLRSKKKWENTRAAMRAIDTDGDGQLTHAEIGHRVTTSAKSKDVQRFAAADGNGDGVLSETEFHAFAHPDSHRMVLKLESEHQFGNFDRDGNGRVSFEEFKRDDEKHEDFSEDAAREDYFLHDLDDSGDLDANEFERLLAGHDLLLESINKVISAVDSDGDGHISISEEIPDGVAGLLNSEYIEDYFYHEYAGRHEEL